MVRNAAIKRTEGVNLVLRLIELDDAAYVYSLRTNPAYNSHLSQVIGTVDNQRKWIENYKEREDAGKEFYSVIERRDGMRCGVVRLYEIEAGCFNWGSWILDDNKPHKAALESAILIYMVGFGHFGCSRARFDVRVDNSRTLAFHRRFGARQIGSDELNIYFEYTRERFGRDYNMHMRALNVETLQ